jgi:hypothetical protein
VGFLGSLPEGPCRPIRSAPHSTVSPLHRVASHLKGSAGSDPFWTLVLAYVAALAFTELATNNAAAC